MSSKPWTSSPVASHAPTSRTPARGSASPDPDPGSGSNSLGSFARYDLVTSSWKTSQGSLLEGWATYSASWPRAGTMQSGIAYQRPRSVPHISGIGCSSSPHGEMWPTPRSYSHDTSHMPGLTSLDIRVRGLYRDKPRYWPTATVGDSRNSARHTTTTGKGNSGTTLVDAMRMWPTPLSGDHRSGQASRAGGRRSNLNDSVAASSSPDTDPNSASTGLLSPHWTAWLMGFPAGWLD